MGRRMAEEEETEGGGATSEFAPRKSTPSSWAHRHPWVLAIVTGVLLAVATSLFGRLEAHDDPMPVGAGGTIGDFRYRLTAMNCGLPIDPPDPSLQSCEAVIRVRNNGKRSASPDANVDLLVGDEVYAKVTAFLEDVLPRREIEVHTSFTIPSGVSPTELRIATCCGFFDLLVPFYNEWVVYDLA